MWLQQISHEALFTAQKLDSSLGWNLPLNTNMSGRVRNPKTWFTRVMFGIWSSQHPFVRRWHETGAPEEPFNRSQSENERTFCPCFHSPPTNPPRGSRDYTQWAHYRLFTSVFCIWRADKPVVVTYRPTHNAHNGANSGLWCSCTKVWRCVGWPGVISLPQHSYPPLLTSNNAFVCIFQAATSSSLKPALFLPAGGDSTGCKKSVCMKVNAKMTLLAGFMRSVNWFQRILWSQSLVSTLLQYCMIFILWIMFLFRVK